MLLSESFKSLILAGGALFAAVALGGCDRQTAAPAQPTASAQPASVPADAGLDRSHRGSELPDLSFADTAGNELALTSLKGKPVLLNLWATWCAPCVAEMPALDKLATDRGATLQVVTVSQDLKQPEKVAAFFAQRKLTQLRPWLDPENRLSDHYAANTLPTTVYYDAQGREVWRFTGPREWGDAATASLLAEAK